MEAATAAKFLKRILEVLCRHEFSWPHSGAQGHDYQVCVRCGAVYEYDWVAMHRTRRAYAALENRGDLKS